MIRGVIFDLDGVLCSTDEYHYAAWKALAEHLGIHDFGREDNARQRGVSRMESLEVVLAKSDATYTPAQKQAFADYKNELYVRMLGNMSPADLSDDVRRTLDTLRARGYRLAVGSSSRNTPLILRKLGLGDYFDAVADGNMISHSKPDPEVFLLAADLLDLPSADCLVAEDAESGVTAGLRGGFTVAAIGEAAKLHIAHRDLGALSDLLDFLPALA